MPHYEILLKIAIIGDNMVQESRRFPVDYSCTMDELQRICERHRNQVRFANHDAREVRIVSTTVLSEEHMNYRNLSIKELISAALRDGTSKLERELTTRCEYLVDNYVTDQELNELSNVITDVMNEEAPEGVTIEAGRVKAILAEYLTLQKDILE